MSGESEPVEEIKKEVDTDAATVKNDQAGIEIMETPQNGDVTHFEDNSVKAEVRDEEISVKDEQLSDESVEEEETTEEEQLEEEKPKEKIVTRQSTKPLYQEPLFAEVCSFFNNFGTSLGLKYSIEHLERLLCTYVNGKADPGLINLHMFLMRRVRLNWARADKFDLCLKRYCEICPSLDSEELELKRLEYADLSINAKLTILKALCESQFDFNYKFKETIFHTFSHSELRLSPIGYDKNGCAFYYQQDFELSTRVYSFELDDAAGTSWMLRAKSMKDLYKLIQDLKRPDYGTRKESDEEDLDEDRIVQSGTKSESKDEESRDGQQEAGDLIIEMSETEREKILLINKKFTMWELFRGEDQLNKKQKQKEERRKAREAEKAGPEPTVVVQKPKKVEEEPDDVKSEKSEEKVEEEEEDSEFMEDRRILPRRSARNAAITNLKQFTTPIRKRTGAKKAGENMEKQDSERERSEDSEVYDDSDEEDELGSSDDEFVGPRTGKKRRKRKAGNKPRKPRQTPLIPRKRAPKPVAFDEESSSDEDAEEVKQKERKKANEKTLCMKCRGSKRPDVLLLCDKCDDAWHIYCLRPPLHYVPDGDWYSCGQWCVLLGHKQQHYFGPFNYTALQRERLIKEEEERKKTMELERLSRRRHNGIDLKNIVSTRSQYDSADQQQSSEEEIDDGQRRSKRRALKRVLQRSYRDHYYQRDLYTGPVVTIAEGRSRRNLNKVDYNFREFDEQLQDALDAIDSPPAQNTYERQSGLGLGKDMATILKAEERRGSLEDEESAEKAGNENNQVDETNGGQDDAPKNEDGKPTDGVNNSESNSQQQRKQGRPPAKKKSTKKLTDLDVDNATESETDSYHASSDEEQEQEDEEISTDEYVPSEEDRPRGRGSGRGANYYSRTRSDDEFIDDSDSDFEPTKRKGRGGNRKRKAGGGRGGRKAKRGKKWSSTEEETEESESEYQSESSEDEKASRRVGKKPTKASVSKQPTRKWGPKVSSNDEQEDDSEVEMDEERSSASGPTTKSGRPLRKAATEMKKKMEELEKQGEEVDQEVLEEEDEQNEKPLSNAADISKIVGKPRRPTKDDEDEFKPEDGESISNPSSEEDEQIEEELANELKEKRQQKQKRHHTTEPESEDDDRPFEPRQTPSSAKFVKVPQSISSKSPRSSSTIKRQETQESQRGSTPEDPAPSVVSRRGGRRKSNAPVMPKSPPKTSPKKIGRQPVPPTSSQNVLKRVQILPKQPTHSSHQPLQRLEQMRPLVHTPAYIGPSQTVAYALPPHVRPMSGIHYVQGHPGPHQPVMQPYEYYGGPPQQYVAHPSTTHVYTQPVHIAPSNSYQVYAAPGYEHGGQSQVTQLQTLRPVDPESLGHVLAGAMNPESL